MTELKDVSDRKCILASAFKFNYRIFLYYRWHKYKAGRTYFYMTSAAAKVVVLPLPVVTDWYIFMTDTSVNDHRQKHGQ